MLPILEKIITLSEARIPHLIKYGDSGYSDFYHGSDTFVDGIEDELQEMKEELKSGNRVFLEDELGDIFWDYICLLENLKQEGKISSKEKVFERCLSKFSERLNPDGSNNGDWVEVKNKQKERLIMESHNSI